MPARVKVAPRVTINDVAERAGVSTATVSRVLNNTGAVASETAERVHHVIAELNYIPHVGARDLAGARTNSLGLIFPEISGSFFSASLKGIEEYVHQHGFALLIYSTHGHDHNDHRYVLPLGEHNTDGLIVFTNSLPDADLARLYARHFPMVLLHHTPPTGMDIPCITFENKNGARAIVEHLITVHRYRRIAFLAGPEDNEDASWRELGYREALAQYGIPYDPALVAQGDFDDLVAETAVNAWLENSLDMDAIFAADDESATGTLTALRRAGKNVPQDITVVGFDDGLLSRHLTPPLTTIRAPIEEAGRHAAEQLIRLIQTGQAESLILLPTQLVIRQSCGCP